MDRAQALRWLRGLLMLCLAWELLCMLSFPRQTPTQLRETLHPAWRHSLEEDYDADFEDAAVCAVYMSSLLLKRCQATMTYNISSGLFETPSLPLWRHTDELLSSDPAVGWATWQELVMTAKHPWVVHWASWVVPDSWHVMPPVMRENLQLLQAAVPVVAPPGPAAAAAAAAAKANTLASTSSSAVDKADGDDEDEEDDPSASFWVARCVSAVNQTTLRPADEAHCTVTVRGQPRHVGGTFLVQPGPPPPSAAATAALGCGPGAASLLWLLGLVRRWPRGERLLRLLALVGPFLVPTFSRAPLGALLQQLGVLELEYGLKVAAVYLIVLLVTLRNWLYHLSVAYKVSARLGLLAFHNPWERLTGVVLTFIGVVLGLWQSIAFGVLDICLDALLARAVVAGLSSSATLAWLAWQLSMSGGVFEGRLAVKAWGLAKQAWGEMTNLVAHPRALLNQQAAGVAAPPRHQVATVGSWPAPLVIPEAVDDLSASQVPRGFICPITQAIMRQPALLLHDATVSPSTYDRDAITQWLAEHSSDPKNPGTKLVMKSVRLVHNGDLARAIEDWVADKAAAVGQADRDAADQLRFIQARLAAMRATAQARLAAQQQEAAAAPAGAGGAPGEEPAAAAAVAAAGPAAAAAAAANALPVVAAAALVAETGQLVRQPSASLAGVAALDLPQVAAAGLASLSSATRRMTTRAAARRLREQQLREQAQEQEQGQGHEQQQRRGQQRQRRRRQSSGFLSSDLDDEDDGRENGRDSEQERPAAGQRNRGYAAAAGGDGSDDGDDSDGEQDGGSRRTPSGSRTGLRTRRSQRATPSSTGAR